MKKKIFFIAPVYFDYHKLIIENFKQKGYLVDFLEDKNSGFLYNFSKKSKFLLHKYKEAYQKEILLKLNENSYDLMIVIGGKTLNVDFWRFVDQNYNFKKILYQWDSYRNFDYRSMIPFFDTVKSFDSQDAKELSIPYLPLFYKKNGDPSLIEDIDFVFIGIWHSDRIGILNEIAEFSKKNNFKYMFKVFHPWYMYLYMVYIKRNLSPSSFFTFKSIALNETLNYYSRAKCVVDINHPWQSGLTMRTIETIGRGKKLVTTNTYIKNEEFYDEKMIKVIKRDKIEINKDFLNFKRNYINIEKLEISNWVENLLN